jgi:hypothetical protein
MITFTQLADRIVCDQCNATVALNDVRTHVCGLDRDDAILLVHNTKVSRAILSTRNPLDPNPFYCGLCGAKFANLGLADIHECGG